MFRTPALALSNARRLSTQLSIEGRRYLASSHVQCATPSSLPPSAPASSTLPSRYSENHPSSSVSQTPPSQSSENTLAPNLSQQDPVQRPNRKRTPEWLLKSPTYVAVIKGMARLLGHNSKASTSIRETRFPYSRCAERDAEEAHFLHEECRLSPTYQTWFQITNLHVWLLTTRYRALPPTHGRLYVQELVNHFFYDVEDRMRFTLSNKAPERVVKGYMKEMRDQWAGAGLAYDLALVGSDIELSAAVWRNIFAARGLDGKGEVIGKPGKQLNPRPVQESSTSSGEDVAAADGPAPLPLSERELADLPFQLYVFTAYIRRELSRLESILDEDVIAGRMGSFGSFENHVQAIERDFMLESEERSLLGLDEDVPGSTKRPAASSRVSTDSKTRVTARA